MKVNTLLLSPNKMYKLYIISMVYEIQIIFSYSAVRIYGLSQRKKFPLQSIVKTELLFWICKSSFLDTDMNGCSLKFYAPQEICASQLSSFPYFLSYTYKFSVFMLSRSFYTLFRIIVMNAGPDYWKDGGYWYSAKQ